MKEEISNDLLINNTINIDNAIGEFQSSKDKQVEYWNKIRYYLDISMIILIILGALHYIKYQKEQYGKDFSWNKFMFVNSCSNKN